MLISTVTASPANQFAISVTPEPYDAIRFPHSLLLDSAPAAVDADRLAVAAALLFGTRTGDRLVLPEGVSPLACAAAEQYLSPSTTRVGPVEHEARRIPPGPARLIVRGDSDYRPVSAVPVTTYRTSTIRFTRSDQWAGPTFAVDEVIVPCNGWLFESPQTSRGVVLLALGVLFAEDAGAGLLVVPELENESPAERERLGALLAATGLRIGSVD